MYVYVCVCAFSLFLCLFCSILVCLFFYCSCLLSKAREDDVESDRWEGEEDPRGNEVGELVITVCCIEKSLLLI